MNDIDISLILAQLFNFLILFFLFKYFVSERLHIMIAERKKEIQKLELAETQYQEKMQLVETQKQEILTQAHATSQTLLSEAEALARAKSEILLHEAQEKAEAIVEWGRQEIEKERISMLAQMKKHIMDVSLKVNEKMFGPEKNNKKFIEKEFEKL